MDFFRGSPPIQPTSYQFISSASPPTPKFWKYFLKIYTETKAQYLQETNKIQIYITKKEKQVGLKENN